MLCIDHNLEIHNGACVGFLPLSRSFVTPSHHFISNQPGAICLQYCRHALGYGTPRFSFADRTKVGGEHKIQAHRFCGSLVLSLTLPRDVCNRRGDPGRVSKR